MVKRDDPVRDPGYSGRDKLKRAMSKWPWRTAPTQETWSLWMAFGIALIIIGLVALSAVITAARVTMLALSAILLVGGLVQIVRAISAPDWVRTVVTAITGVLFFAVGIYFWVSPQVGLTVIVSILGALFIAIGVFRLVASLSAPQTNRVWLLINGVVTLILGVLLVARWPEVSLWVVGLYLGLEFLTDGITSVALSLMARRRSMA